MTWTTKQMSEKRAARKAAGCCPRCGVAVGGRFAWCLRCRSVRASRQRAKYAEARQ